MSRLRAVLKLFASPSLAQAAILAALGLLTLALMPIQFIGAPGGQAALLAGKGPFLAVYVVLAVATLCCMAFRLRAVPKLVSASPRLPRRDMATNLSDSAFDPVRCGGVLRAAGFRKVSISENEVAGIRFRWSPLGTYVLHAALLLIAAGALLHSLPGGSFSSRQPVTRGDSIGQALPGFAVDDLLAEKTVDELNGLTVTSVTGTAERKSTPDELSVRLRDRSGRARRLVAGSAVVADPFTIVTAEDFGMSARVSLTPSGSVTPIARKTAQLTMSRGVTAEYFEIPAEGRRYRLGVRSVKPFESTSGTDTRLIVSLARDDSAGGWRLMRGPTVLTPGSSRRFGEVSLRTEEALPYATLRVTRSAGLPLIVAGFLAAVIGSLLRLGIPRTEARLERTRNGTALTVAADVHRTSLSTRRAIERAWRHSE